MTLFMDMGLGLKTPPKTRKYSKIGILIRIGTLKWHYSWIWG